jgi:hypothetical protein
VIFKRSAILALSYRSNASDRRVIMDEESVGMLKDKIVAYFEILLQRFIMCDVRHCYLRITDFPRLEAGHLYILPFS